MLGPDAGIKEDQANAIIMAARAHWFPEGTEKGATEGQGQPA
jgi:hypothetical protein